MIRAANDNETDFEWLARRGKLGPDAKTSAAFAEAGFRLQAAVEARAPPMRTNDMTRISMGGGSPPHDALLPIERATHAARGAGPTPLSNAEEAVGAFLWPAVKAFVMDGKTRREIGEMYGCKDRKADGAGEAYVRAGLWQLSNTEGYYPKDAQHYLTNVRNCGTNKV
jgi:hypothetical protein